MTTLRLVGGLPLIVGGSLATADACCCGGCCVIDAVVDYTKTEGTCVGYCQQVHKRPPDETTQESCESTYDGCLISSVYTEVDGLILEFSESECESGSPAWPNDCGLYIVTDNPSECPENWFYGPVGPTAGVNGCYTYGCVESCEDCDAAGDAAGATVVGCVEGAFACVESNTFTKHYGIWHPAVWYANCSDYVAPMALAAGPGTELKSLLATFGIQATPNCKCNKMAKKMDEWGPDECLNHIEEIVDVMEEEAKKRKLPFLRSLGRALVRKAIRRARGNSQ